MVTQTSDAMVAALCSVGSKVMLMALVGLGTAPHATRDSQIERRQWPVPDAILRTGTLSFTGRSTLGSFVGTTSTVRGELQGNGHVANARGWVEATVATLSTKNDHRDRDLRSTLEVDQFPTMRFDLMSVTLESSATPPDSVRAALNGRLTIHGVARDVSIPATLVISRDTIDVAGGFPLDLADYRVGGLTRFLGALRMQRNIEVSFRLRFEATPQVTAGEKER